MKDNFVNPLHTNAGAKVTPIKAIRTNDGKMYVRMTNGSLRRCIELDEAPKKVQHKVPQDVIDYVKSV